MDAQEIYKDKTDMELVTLKHQIKEKMRKKRGATALQRKEDIQIIEVELRRRIAAREPK